MLNERRLIIPIILLIMIANLALYFPAYQNHIHSTLSTFNGEPLLTTPDGYYFLRHAQEEMNGTYTREDKLRPYAAAMDLPLISKLAATVASITGYSLETIAFYLPPLLAALLIPVMVGIGRAAGLKAFGYAAAVFGAISPAWFYRTIPGYYDTDGLNQVLFWCSILFGYQALHKEALSRVFYTALWLSSLLILHSWWPQAGLSFALLSTAFLLFSAFIEFRLYRRVAFLIAFFVTAAAISLGLIFPSALPSPINNIFLSMQQHLLLALGHESAFYFSAGQSVSELKNLEILAAVRDICGVPLLLLPLVIGGWYAFRYSRTAFLTFIIPGAVFIGLSFLLGNRFLMFAAPAVGLCGAYFFTVALPKAFGRFKWPTLCSGVIAACAIVWAIQPLIKYDIGMTSNSSAALLATKYRVQSPSNAATWNWWGPGYFIQYFAHRKTFIDGGSQTDERTFIASVPYAASDPTLARNWIKFFTEHPNGIQFLTRKFKGKNTAINFLFEALSRPDRLAETLKKYNAPHFGWDAYLYPSPLVYLFIKHDMLTRGTWLSSGQWRPEAPTRLETTTFMYNQAHINRKQGTVTLPGETVEYSKLFFVTPKALSHDPVREKGPVAIVIKGLPRLFLIRQKHFNVLTFRLLFISPSGVDGFIPVTYHPYVGGVWRVI